ncbi:b(0,+)-type amino acid transporter 1 isoform X2 [Strongylocentrotus purpuratus]|uniref:b(0,+)-type amino acid transporter 1 n=1 Tax=Strongylocentrotus purpuratus TaxID=7668 RepID=A0A7M7N6W2_STRPU|nr:b(0,+)-type amino acid transporter 1 isoform X2 [Strongylocentrotus purpuratus]|eukprot:XP_011660558.1 PREDICTED: b(0,+)-type amino acid transporter 1 isoform X4 [Strongylocentrotus purpuratus]
MEMKEKKEMNGDAEKAADDTVSHEKVGLKQEVGLLSGVALIVGSMIGSGIFVSPKGILRETQSVGMSMIIWLLCAILAMTGALSYAELGTLIHKSGAEHAYLNDIWGPMPAFIFSWTYTLVIKPSIISIVSLITGTYVVESCMSTCDGNEQVMLMKIFAALSIGLICFINCYSVKWANAVQVIFTAAKLLALVIIVVIGFIRLFQGETGYLAANTAFIGSSPKAFSYGIAFYQGLWAYESWNHLNFVSEELVNPTRNLPLAIGIGIPLVALFYLLVNVSYFTVMSPQELLSSNAVAVTFAERTLGPMAFIIPIFVCFSTFGSANGNLFASGRLPYAAGKEGHLPQVMSFIHMNKYTPCISLITTSTIAVLMLIPGDFDTLINYFSFATWFFYCATVTGLLYWRYKYPDLKRPFKVPIICPIIFVVASVYLVVAPIINEPLIEFLYAFLFIVAGLIFYFPFIKYKYSPKFMDSFTLRVQKLFKVVPTAKRSSSLAK